MAHPRTRLEILNKSLQKVAEIKNLYPLNNQGMILRYSKELSDFGKCLFRVRSNDPVFEQLGDILTPHAYSVRIMRGNTKIWQGAIVDNLQRTRNYIEVQAMEYEYYLDKILVRRTSLNPTNGQDDHVYRIFKTGTMASAVTSLVSDAATDFGGNHPLSTMTAGDIENPNYPPGFSDANNQPLTGAWNFSDYIQLQFDYHSLFYVLSAFGAYASCDFELDENLRLNFKKFLGNKHTNVVFEYGTRGNVIDYNSPRLGQRMVNNLWGIGADSEGKILHVEQIDTTSRELYGKLEGAQAFADVKDKNFLTARVNESLFFTKTFNDSPVNILLNERGFFLGRYDIGDIVTVKIKDNVIDYNEPRRVVGITVNLHNTGREITTVQTNTPKPEDLGA